MNSTNNNALEKKNNSVRNIVFLILIAFVAAILSSMPALRNFISRASHTENERKILSKIFTNYDGINFVAFKIKTHNAIELEIYEKDAVTYSQKLKHKFTYPNDQDSFLIVEGNTVNLALSDIDQDNIKEILMPTVDQFGVSRLNIIKYNMDLKQFTQLVASE